MRTRSLVAALLLAALLLAPSAAAHANYYASEPKRGARLTQAPSSVTVTLSEAIDPRGSSVEVEDQDGTRVDRGPVRYQAGDTPSLSVDLQAPLPPGAYLVTWRVLSSVDGHHTDGSFGFALGGFEPPAGSEPEKDLEFVSAASRAVAYAGYALGFGALAFLWLVEPRPWAPARRVLFARAFAAGGGLVLVGLVGLTLHTIQEGGLGAAFFETEVGREFGVRLAVAALTFAVGLASLWTRRLPVVPMSVALVLGAIGNSRFAHTADRGLWAVAVDLVHLVSVAAWLGGLAFFLHYLLRLPGDGAGANWSLTGLRFSRLALPCVVTLGVTGLVSTLTLLGWEILRDPLAMTGHAYGAVLVGKVCLFVLMVALAGLNRFLYLRQRAVGGLRRAVLAEAALGAVVLVLAGFLTAISPPSEAAEGDGPEVQAVGFGTDHNVTLRIERAPVVGDAANITFYVEEASTGRALETAIRVRVTIAESGENASAGSSYNSTHVGAGVWSIGEHLFAHDGPHVARVEIQTETVYSDLVEIAFHVGRGGA